MYTDPQILYDTTLSLDMNARHRYVMHWYHQLHGYCSSLDMVLYYTLTTVSTCTSDTQIWYTAYCYTYMFHWYTDIPIYGLPHFIGLLSSLHECSVHSYVMFTHHNGSLLHMHVLFLSSCHMDHCLIACIFRFSCYMIISCY